MERRLAALFAAVSILLFGEFALADHPEVGERIEVSLEELPPPYATKSASNAPLRIARPEGATLDVPPGFHVNLFADGLDHPRRMAVAPNGDVFLAQSSEGRITLLRDADGDGKAEMRTVFLSGLNSPFGMALIGNDFYVGNTDSIMRFPYEDGATAITAPGEKLVELPAGPINIHWVKNIVASPDGSRLYAGVGSNSNLGENGMKSEEGRAAIHEIDLATGKSRIFASGLRNPVGLAFQPDSGELWTTVNERDELGSDLVPDYMTSVKEDGFYGWPYSYFGQHLDLRAQPQRPDLVAKAIVPDYALGPHTASLGLTFYDGTLFPAHYRGAPLSASTAPGTGARSAATT